MAEFVAASEVVALREVLRDHCRQVWDEQAVRAVSEHAKPASDAWRMLGAELEVLGLTVPERWGGAGAGLVEAAVVAEELGAVLAPLPYVSAVLAARMLLDSGDEAACAELLPSLCTGTRTFAVAGTDAAGRWAGPPSISARSDGYAWLLTGSAGSVVDGEAATDLLVVAEGGALFHVDSAAPGLVRTPVPTLDLTRRQADVRFDRVSARPVGRADPVRAGDTATALLAAELVGVARTMLDTTVAYARERRQFGRPIGAFQAVKLRCADMLVELELARSAAAHAAWTRDHGGDDPALAASLAHVVAAGAARQVAKSAVQVFGGVAITWEHHAHLYYKRAVANAALWGGRTHRSRLAALAAAVPEEGSCHVR